MERELILAIVRIILISFTIAYLFSKYKHQKYSNLKWLIYGLILLTTTDVLLVGINPIGNHSVRGQFTQASLEIVFMIIAIYFILIFLESFSFEDPLTKRLRRLLVSIVVMATGLLVLSFIIHSFEADTLIFDIEGILTVSDEVLEQLNGEQQAILGIYSLFSLMSLILIIVELIMLFKKLKTQRKKSNNPRTKKYLQYMTYSLYIMILGPILLVYVEALTNMSIMLGLGLFIFFYFKGGLFLFQEETLRRLMVMDDNGIPYFAYKFRQFNSDEAAYQENKDDILFTGALKAVSSLFANLTGSDQAVKEIILDKSHLLLQRVEIGPMKLSIVLIADKSTNFFRNALDAFSLKFTKQFTQIKESQVFSGEREKEANLLVEDAFGFRE